MQSSRVRFVCVAIALAAWMSVSACTKTEPPPAAAVPPTAAAPTSAGAGSVDGTGPVPAPGASVVVMLEPKTSRSFPPQDEVPVMDQVGQTFSPALLIVRTGQPVKFRNSDDTLHNVNVKEEGTRVQSFNVAIPTDGVFEFTFPHDGFYRVGCDIHPAMAASIFAASTPYATLSDGDGRFSFSDVPPGTWTLTVYDAGRKLQRDVEVKGGVTPVTIE